MEALCLKVFTFFNLIKSSSYVKKYTWLHSIVIYVSCILLLKITSLTLEMAYRNYCYPMTFYGLFLSLITSTSDACNYIRTATISIDAFIIQSIISMITYGVHSIFKMNKHPNQ